MNQALTTRPETSVSAVGISAGAGGSKIAPQNLGEVVRFAEVMSKADIALPKHLRGNPGACMAVALQALEWEMSPFAVASKSYAVNGAIAYEAQLIAAVVNTRSGIKGRLKYAYEGEGDSLQCTVTGTIDGEEYSYTSPRFDQITPKNSPLWKTDPKQQIGYYSARSWARRYTPEVILGVYDRDEAQQFQGPDNAKDVTPLSQRLADARTATQASQDEQEGFDLAHVARETETPLHDNPEAEETESDAVSSPNASETPENSPSGEEGGDLFEQDDPAPPPSPILMEFAGICYRMVADQQYPTDMDTFMNAVNGFKFKEKSPEEFDQAQSIVKSYRAVINEKTDLESAASFIAEMLECKVEDFEKKDGR